MYTLSGITGVHLINENRHFVLNPVKNVIDILRNFCREEIRCTTSDMKITQRHSFNRIQSPDAARTDNYMTSFIYVCNFSFIILVLDTLQQQM